MFVLRPGVMVDGPEGPICVRPFLPSCCHRPPSPPPTPTRRTSIFNPSPFSPRKDHRATPSQPGFSQCSQCVAQEAGLPTSVVVCVIFHDEGDGKETRWVKCLSDHSSLTSSFFFSCTSFNFLPVVNPFRYTHQMRPASVGGWPKTARRSA